MRATWLGVGWLVLASAPGCAGAPARTAVKAEGKTQAIPATYDARFPSAACAACHEKPAADLASTWSRHRPIACAVCHRNDHGATSACAFCHRAPHADDRGAGCGDCHGRAHALEKT
jgi:hypothetical protein